MTKNFTIRCNCGALEGRVQNLPSDAGTRLVCYCDDCQAFAHYLGADDKLDAHGGTDLYQFSPANLTIDKGKDQLACLKLGPKGILRWYAACCRTPIGNTVPTRHLPHLGLASACIQKDEKTGMLDSLLGPVSLGVFGRFAKGDRANLNAHDKAPLSLILRAIGKLLKRRLRGDHRSTPFFDTETGAPVVTPKVLNETERLALAPGQRTATNP